jgi:hypothetical protein
MAREEVAKTRRCCSGARNSRPTATGTKSRSQLIAMDQSPFSRWAAVLPVHPIYRVALEVAADGGIDGGKEKPFANLREKPESLEFVLYRIFEFGKAQLNSRPVQGLMQFLEGVGCGDVHAGDRLCRNDHPGHGSGR